jgi:predicted AAA+ superfamily ATPase
LDPKEITASIALLSREDIISGKTLLFLDEIQDCPRAITALRYFFEQMPGLHVIGAGSLMEFTLGEKNLKIPVGRIQYVFMKPLSFGEFLDAVGDRRLRQLVDGFEWGNKINPAVHDKLISLVKKYSIVGGMPSVVEEYASSGDFNRCQRIQLSIILTYREDFGKYAGKVKRQYLEKVFYAIPKMVGNKFKYSHVDNTVQSRNLKEALELLEKAGVIYRVKSTGGRGLPLEVEAKQRHFKTIFLDTGLMQNICGLSSETLIAEDFIGVNAGALAEQFVGQELLAYQDLYDTYSVQFVH